MLWLALYLPRLPLEIYTRTAQHSDALIVSHGQGRARVVLHANPAAREQGIDEGVSVAAARALLANVRDCPRDVAAEAQTLARLAAWAGQYTSMVSIQPPHALLLEIGGSLQLFGGVQRLWSHLAAGVAALGFEAVLAVAPTPTAAYWLAHAHQGIIVVVPQDALVVLGRSPISRLPWAPLVLDKLQAVGLRYLRDVWRLPRDSLVRRFGVEVLHQMDRARGDAADPRVAYVAPMQFSAGLTLPAPTADSAALVFATQRLLLEFAGFLRARGAGIQHFELHLIDAQTNLTQVNVGTATVHRQVAQWRVLVREHLEKLQLSAPVEQLRLHAEHITPIADSHDDLFDRTQHIGEGELWMARVRARLGEEVIQGMCAVAEHRPEYAWRATPPTLAPQKDQLDIQAHYRAGRTPERPLWLLATPLALQIKNGRLWREGALHRVRGPERIESGWWDAAPIARDYYVVENAAGIRYWVFREEGEWFLHGVFW